MIDSFQNIAVTSFPKMIKIDFKSIENKYLKVILINTFLVFVIAFLLVSFADYKGLFEFIENTIWIYLSMFSSFVFILLVKKVGFKKRKYAVREKDISYEKGVLFRSLTSIPFNRIQHIEIDEGPISRLFGLVSLSVFTAGDSSDDLKISGLLKEEAKQIKEFISNKIDG
ncbi:MAG: membrane protein YdbS with pleckstrin-like domain [Polaribacter sp.]|jgi:membrane protein YdbS with pleckstrin-like domain